MQVCQDFQSESLFRRSYLDSPGEEFVRAILDFNRVVKMSAVHVLQKVDSSEPARTFTLRHLRLNDTPT